MKLNQIEDKQSLEALPKESLIPYHPDGPDISQLEMVGSNKTIDQYNRLEFSGDVDKLASKIGEHSPSGRGIELEWHEYTLYLAKEIINSMPYWLTVRKGE